MSDTNRKTGPAVGPSLRASLPILVRPHRKHEATDRAEVNASDASLGSGAATWVPSSETSSRRAPQSTGGPRWQSPLATPPPDPGTENGIPFIDGIGSHFPTRPPTRAESLSMDSENVASSCSTPRFIPEMPVLGVIDCVPSDLAEGFLDTPQASPHGVEHPMWSDSCRFGWGSLGNARPPMPVITPNKKRAADTLLDSRPAKRRKVDSHHASEDAEDKVYPAEDRETAGDQAFCRARELTKSLVQSTGRLFDTVESLAENSDEAETVAHRISRSSPDSQSVGARNDGAELDLGGRAESPSYVLETEYLSEEEIEEHLAEALASYRAFHLDPDEAEPPRPRDHERAQRSEQLLRAIFESQPASARDMAFLLHDEEEDALNVLMARVREKRIPSRTRKGFEDMHVCLEQLGSPSTSVFVKQAVLSARTKAGFLLTAQLPVGRSDDALGWNVDSIRGVFGELEQLEIA